MNRFLIILFALFPLLAHAKPILSFNGFKWGTHISTIKKGHKSYRDLGLESDFGGYFLSYDFEGTNGEYLGEYPLKRKTFYFNSACPSDVTKCLLTNGSYKLKNPENIDLNKLINKYQSTYTYIGATEQPHNYKLDGTRDLPGIKDRYVFDGTYGGVVLIEVITPSRDGLNFSIGKEYHKGIVEEVSIRYLDREKGSHYIVELKELLRNTESINKVNDI